MGTISERPDSRQSGETVQYPVIPKRFPASTADHFMYLTRIVSDLTLRDSLHFSGRIDAGRMARTVRLTLDAEPVLGCRFRRGLTGIYWERLPDLDSRVYCPVIEKQDIEAELQEFLGKPIDATAGPQVEACLFRSERDTLGIKINHVAADGASHMDYLKLLAKTYRELGLNADYYPQPNLGADRMMGPLLRNINPLEIIRGIRYNSRRQPDIPVFPPVRQDLTKKAFIVRPIGQDRFARIKAYSRLHRASIGDILLTSVYRAMAVMLSSNNISRPPVQVTVSLRRHVPPGWRGTICNLSGIFSPGVIVYPGDSFKDTLAHVHEAMTTAKANQPWLGGIVYLGIIALYPFPLLRQAIRAILRRRLLGHRFKGVVFSNIGVVETEQFSFGNTPFRDFNMFGPVLHPPGCLLSANTLGDELFFTMGYYSSATEPQIIDRFLDMVVSELPD